MPIDKSLTYYDGSTISSSTLRWPKRGKWL